MIERQDYDDMEALVRHVANPLESIAGNLVEIRECLDTIIATGATVTLSIKIGGEFEQ